MTSPSSKTFLSCPLTLPTLIITRRTRLPCHTSWYGFLTPWGLDTPPNLTSGLPPTPTQESLPLCPLKTHGTASTNPLHSQLLHWTILPLALIKYLSILAALQDHPGSFLKSPMSRPHPMPKSLGVRSMPQWFKAPPVDSRVHNGEPRWAKWHPVLSPQRPFPKQNSFVRPFVSYSSGTIGTQGSGPLALHCHLQTQISLP